MTSLMTIMAKTPRKSGTPIFNLDTALATFTPGMALREGNGPFSAAPIIQTGFAGGGAGDTITFPKGTQVSAQFYTNIDPYQGNIVFWITPEWDGSEGIQRYITRFGNDLYIHKSAANALTFSAATNIATSVDISGWTAGTTYCVSCAWDLTNTLDGTNYIRISIDDAHTFGEASTGAVEVALANIGLGYRTLGNSAINAIIEGFTVYRRPLFDGTYGIDVGNGDELAAIYNAGSGKDATEITGSWDVCLCVPGVAPGDLTTGTGNAWSHPHSTSETNLTDSFMQTTYGSSAWSTKGTPSAGPADMADADKVYAVGGYDWTAAADGDGIEQSLSGLTAESSWVIRAVAHVDDANPYRLRVYDDTNGAEIAQLTVGASSSRTSPAPAQFSFELPNIARGTGAADCTAITISIEGTAASQTVYAHQCELHENRLANPSFETGSGAPWIPDGYSNNGLEAADTTQELVTVHSGSSAVACTSGFTANAEFISRANVGTLTVGQFLCVGFFFNSSDANLKTVALLNDNNLAVMQNDNTTISKLLL